MEIPRGQKHENSMETLYGIPCETLRGITMERDGSTWSFHVLPTWNYTMDNFFHENSTEYKTGPLKFSTAENYSTTYISRLQI